MPLHIKTPCPHCREQNTLIVTAIGGFTVNPEDSGAGRIYNDENIRNLDQNSKAAIEKTSVEAAAIAHCPKCYKPTQASFEIQYAHYKRMRAQAYSGAWLAGPHHSIAAVETIPAIFEEKPVDYLPDNIANLLFEAKLDAADPKRSPAGVIAKCRSVVEMAARKLGAEGENNAARIDDLRKGLLTEAMCEWAHKVRLNGNDAIHEIKGSAEDADALVRFVELFAELTFDLPRRIEKHKQSLRERADGAGLADAHLTN